ncbi:MAG: signal peptidase I [Desulfurococcaceae archaeon]|nr:signal peptidase I [Desulfurococcaceae archaeon]
MKFRQVVEIAEAIFILILIAFLLYVNVAYHIFGQITLAVVKGSSMLPLLHDNDVVIIVPSKNIVLGDVVVFKNDRGEYVIHRVIAVVECEDGAKIYITKGDNNVFVDSVSFGIALRTSRECSVKDLKVLNGFEMYVQQAIQDGKARGIPSDRIIGKAFTIFGAIIKITGIPSLKS